MATLGPDKHEEGIPTETGPVSSQVGLQCMPVIAYSRQEDGKFGSSLGYTARPYFKIQKKSNRRGHVKWQIRKVPGRNYNHREKSRSHYQLITQRRSWGSGASDVFSLHSCLQSLVSSIYCSSPDRKQKVKGQNMRPSGAFRALELGRACEESIEGKQG